MTSWKTVESDIGKGPFGLFKWIVISIVFISALSGAIYMIKSPGKAAVEHYTNINSFQYKEGMAQQGRILQAQLTELDVMLEQAENAEERHSIQLQQRVVRAQLNAISISSN